MVEDTATLVTQKGADATSWMEDPANFLPDSPATRDTFNLREAAPGETAPRQSLPGPDDLVRPELGGEAEAGEKTARAAIEEQLGQRSDVFTQDEQGKWHRPDGSFASKVETEQLEAKKAELAEAEKAKAAEQPPTPEQAKADEAKAKARQSIGDVAIYDQEGQEVEFPEIAVTYKANGQVREKVPLDKLIRQAQAGAYNEQREMESQSARQEVEQSRARIADYESAVARYEQWFARMFSDDAFYQASKAEYARSHTPEALLAMKDQEIANVRAEVQQREAERQAQDYNTREIMPRLGALLAQLPDDEIVHKAFQGETALMTRHLMVNGKVPPQRLPEVARLIDTVLAPWVDTVTQGRAAKEAKALETAKREAEAAKIALTLERKQTARAIMPRGTAGAIRERPKPLPPPKSAEEANQRLFAQLEDQYGAGPR